MKERQTFTLSPEVSGRARRYARREGISLSALVEQLLREKTKESGFDGAGEATDSRFSQRWTGRGALLSKETPRSEYLRKKYLH